MIFLLEMVLLFVKFFIFVLFELGVLKLESGLDCLLVVDILLLLEGLGVFGEFLFLELMFE